MCPACRRPVADCSCVVPPVAHAVDGIVRVSRETQRRAGKDVTIVRGLPLDAAALAQAARQLKAACGCGGTVKDGAIEVQGDHRDRVAEHLTAQGWTVKLAGG